MQMQQLNQIVDIFDRFRMAPTPIDQYEAIGKPILLDKITPFVNSNKPINFVMLGYPMKSPNTRDKVIGKLPDLAEQVSFDNFTRFNNLIKAVYEPGVNIAIVSDGYVFSDIMEVEDSTVTEYGEVAIDMAGVGPLSWYNLNDFYGWTSPMAAKRRSLMNQFAITAEELERRILLDPDVNFLYRGMIKFMSQDLAIKTFDSSNQLHKTAKRVAREMMMRNEAYSKLVQSEFKDSIRLSMHPSVNNGAKYSFQLIPSPKAWISPWHGALLIKDGSFETIHRKDAEAAHYELVYQYGRPYYFQAN